MDGDGMGMGPPVGNRGVCGLGGEDADNAVSDRLHGSPPWVRVSEIQLGFTFRQLGLRVAT